MRREVRLEALVVGMLTVALLASCAGDSPTGPKFGPPASLLIEGGQDQSAVVGTELTTALTAKVVDASGRPVPGRTVSFRVVSGGGSVFVGSAVSADDGLARDRWTLGTAVADSQRVEARTVDATGAALVAVFRASARPDVPAAVNKVAGDTQTVVVGTLAADSLTVRVVDRHGNPVPQTTVRWAVTSGGGTVSNDSSISDVQGLAQTRWTVGQQVSAAQRVTATVGGLAPRTFEATVQPAATVGVAIVTPAAGAASGAPFTTVPRVRLVDVFGNTTTSSANEITLSVSTGGTLLGTTTVTPIAGEATFTGSGLSGKIGEYTLTYSAAGLSPSMHTVLLSAGAPTTLVIATQPGGAVSGAAFATQPMIALRDDAGNLTTRSVTVTASVASGDGVLQGTSSIITDSGVVRFTDLRLDRAQSHTLRFASVTPSLSSISEPVVVAAGEPTRLQTVTAAAGAASGAAFTIQPTVRVVDDYGNTVTDATPSVTVTTSGGTLFGTTTVTPVAGFATLTGAGLSGVVGDYTLTFSAAGLEAATQQIVLAAGAPRALAIAVQPREAVSGAPFAMQPVIELRDDAGNRTSSSSTVTATVESGGGVLLGTTAVAAVEGVATFFDLRIDKAATHSLRFGAGNLISPVLAEPLNVVAGAATQLVVLTAAAGAASGLPFITQPAIEIRDAAGNRVLGNSSAVTLTVSSGASLRGTTTVTAVDGVASFSGAGLEGVVGSYLLTYLSSGLQPATHVLSLDHGPPSELSLLAPAIGAVSGAAFAHQPKVEIRDAAGNRVTSSNVKVSITAEGAQVLNGEVLAVGGLASFSDAGLISGNEGDLSLTYRAADLAPLTQAVLVRPALGIAKTTLASGNDHTCGITSDSLAYCWGRNRSGQLGDGQLTQRNQPVPVAGGIRFFALSAGGESTCGLSTSGTAYCWGAGYTRTPQRISESLKFVSISGGYHACGLTSVGAAYCWGPNNYGQIGDGTRIARSVPTVVSGRMIFSSISANGVTTCGVTREGPSYCWGFNRAGQLGNGLKQDSDVPVLVSGGLGMLALSVGGEHTCGRTIQISYCWGVNSSGQLGDGTAEEKTIPAQVQTDQDFASLVAGPTYNVGWSHSCAVTTQGNAYCWGRNTAGQLGDGTGNERRTPTPVSGAQAFATLALGFQHTCGLTTAGKAFCWGFNFHGNLGTGFWDPSSVPLPVTGDLTFKLP